MIEEQVTKIALTFQRTWSDIFRDHPRYVLDFTWPSVGVLDLITFPLRGAKRLNEHEYSLLQGAAAYLSSMAHRCWSSFPDKVNVDVKCDRETGEISIIARDGRYLRHGEQFCVPVTRALLEILQKPRQPFPFFEQTTRYLDPEQNRLSLFGIGLMTGLSPYGEGIWRERADRDMAPYIVTAESILADSCARYYERVFPREPLGSAESLYHAQLIIPPALHSEPFPALHATVGVAQYFKDQGYEPGEAAGVAQNLACSPDELISSAGYALAVALSDGEPSQALRLLSESKGKNGVELRPAIVLARKIWGRPHDITALIESGELEQARKLALREQRLGLLPLVRLRLDSLGTPQLHHLWLALIWSQAPAARTLLEQLRAKGITSTELELQEVFLHIALGDIDRAQAQLGRFANGHSITDPDDQVNFLELRGVLQLSQKQVEESVATFRQALGIPTVFKERLCEIGNFLALALIHLGRFQEALHTVQTVLSQDQSSLPARVHRIHILRQLERHEEAKSELTRLSRLIPTDRNVFASLVRDIAGSRELL